MVRCVRGIVEHQDDRALVLVYDLEQFLSAEGLLKARQDLSAPPALPDLVAALQAYVLAESCETISNLKTKLFFFLDEYDVFEENDLAFMPLDIIIGKVEDLYDEASDDAAFALGEYGLVHFSPAVIEVDPSPLSNPFVGRVNWQSVALILSALAPATPQAQVQGQ
jgi:hypothetical protein